MMWGAVEGWILSRAWSLDRFVPSAITVLIAAFGTNTLRRSLEEEVRRRINTEAQADAIINVAVTWYLNLTVLTAYLSFFPSWLGMFRTNGAFAWAGMLLFGFAAAVWILVPVLRSPLGELNEPLNPEPTIAGRRSWLEMRLAKNNRTWANFYRFLVLFGHVLLLVGNVLTTPSKS